MLRKSYNEPAMLTHDSLPENTPDTIVSPSKSILVSNPQNVTTTRAGRVVKRPVRFNDFV